MTVQVGLCRTWSETPKTGFLVLRLNYNGLDYAKVTSHSSHFQDWGKEMLGSAWVIMPLAVCVSTFGAANGICFSSGRYFIQKQIDAVITSFGWFVG